MPRAARVGRVMLACAHTPRKRIALWIILFTGLSMCGIALISSHFGKTPTDTRMKAQVAEMQSHFEFLQSLYRAHQLEVWNTNAQNMTTGEITYQAFTETPLINSTDSILMSKLLKSLSGTRVAAGLNPKTPVLLRTAFVFRLLPFLMNHTNSLKPAYHLKGNRGPVKYVIGVPTVKRDKESYLMITLSHLVEGLTEEDKNDTLIVVYIGETNMPFILDVSRKILSKFFPLVESGVIEVISPSKEYYPDFKTIKPTLGDSPKRVKWRTKQNLDTLYLMAYGQTRGTYYLMIEDDIIAKKDYMRGIKEFTIESTLKHPDWFFLEFCQIGGIGKLFKSVDLVNFITYVQLFYYNMPIDWLLESYLADRVCTIDKHSSVCAKNKLLIRPKYKESLFQHIGLYSSLKGKIQKVKDPRYGSAPPFYPHQNPPLDRIICNIEQHGEHSLEMVYEGTGFFWGMHAKVGDTLEFLFAKPTYLESYTFRTGNVEHSKDRLYGAVVEVLPQSGKHYLSIDGFDEFGLADGDINHDLNPLKAIRLRITKDVDTWILISEIELTEEKEVIQD